VIEKRAMAQFLECCARVLCRTPESAADAASALAVYRSVTVASVLPVGTEVKRLKAKAHNRLRPSPKGYPTRNQVLRRGALRRDSLGGLLLFDDSASTLANVSHILRSFDRAVRLGTNYGTRVIARPLRGNK
jgi:hypothetical protein